MRRGGDRVTPALHARVLLRDRVCFLSRLTDTHVCVDSRGYQHEPDATFRLTLDHVKDAPMMGKRAPSDEWHLVAMCWKGNVDVPSREVRQAERSYLDALRKERQNATGA